MQVSFRLPSCVLEFELQEILRAEVPVIRAVNQTQDLSDFLLLQSHFSSSKGTSFFGSHLPFRRLQSDC